LTTWLNRPDGGRDSVNHSHKVNGIAN